MTDLKESHELMTTAEAAKFLRRAPQTLRAWSMRGNGPISPVKARPNSPLLWRRADIERLISGEDGK
ncbi:MAG: helix-turn-helix domain-containing protein [Deltaproteobacteria bacterium]|nr:helix-turn-helix domain-containing protein [Deltaproteobacteria bacterium]